VVWSHACRKKGWGAFLWGLFGALIGQIHMSGFFYVLGLVAFTILHDYRNKQPFKWGYWLLGSVIGGLGLIPWILYILSHHSSTTLAIAHIFVFNFYLDWFLDSHGLNTMYSLHKEFWSFIKEPIVGGHSTYFVGLLHIILAGFGLYTVKRLWGYMKRLFTYLANKELLDKLTINISSTNFYLFSILLGLGIFMTFSGLWIYQHYLIIVFPFTYIFMAKIFQNRKNLFTFLVFAQLLIAVNFLVYIHTHNGVKDGDYGVTYRAQMKTP
ncbi:MAG TPA: hypothetical protein VNZ45_10675, partial [Bacteroidia bacterium]|nr:hypothetical protein [Bacteroidia bacterium]